VVSITVIAMCIFLSPKKNWVPEAPANPPFCSYLLVEISTTKEQPNTSADTKIDASTNAAGRRRNKDSYPSSAN
jgi:hypothetical protein